jgi:hypothetical protein
MPIHDQDLARRLHRPSHRLECGPAKAPARRDKRASSITAGPLDAHNARVTIAIDVSGTQESHRLMGGGQNRYA